MLHGPLWKQILGIFFLSSPWHTFLPNTIEYNTTVCGDYICNLLTEWFCLYLPGNSVCVCAKEMTEFICESFPDASSISTAKRTLPHFFRLTEIQFCLVQLK